MRGRKGALWCQQNSWGASRDLCFLLIFFSKSQNLPIFIIVGYVEQILSMSGPKKHIWIKLRWHLGLENIWHCGEIIQFLTWFATFFFWLSKCFASFHGCFWAFVWFKNENIFVFIKWITVITFVLGLFLKDEIVLGFIQATYL